MATSAEIEKVIENTDMVDLVSPYVTLTKQGKNYKGLCPFHDEKTPSFVVSQEKHLAHCFSCGKGGNPIQFLMDIKQITFSEALKELADKNGISISVPTKKSGQDFSKYYEILTIASQFFVHNLTSTKTGKTALNYLYKRGLDDQAIEHFEIGLAPKGGDSLYKVLKEANILELDMLDLGLIGKNDKGYYDIFSQRITFPIKDEMGHIIGFSARIFDNPDPNQPKYVNTKETFLYKKGSVLYHLDGAKSEILKKKRVVLNEGQMDVISAVQSGLKETICTMGTALTIEQANVLKKYCEDAIICYDGDKAGIAASKKAIQTFKRAGMKVHLVLLPQGMDPDEYVQKFGKDEYLSYFNGHIIDELEYLFETVFLNRNLEDSLVLEEIKKEAFQTINQMPSQTSKEKFLKRLSERLNISLNAILSDYNSYCSIYDERNIVEEGFESDIFTDSYFEEPVVLETIKPKSFELRLFLYARNSKQKALEIDRRINDDLEAFTPMNRTLWLILIDQYYAQYETFDDASFCAMLSPEQKSYYLAGLELVHGQVEVFGDEDLNCIIQKMHEAGVQAENVILSEQIRDSDNMELQLKKISEKFNNRKKIMSTRRK